MRSKAHAARRPMTAGLETATMTKVAHFQIESRAGDGMTLAARGTTMMLTIITTRMRGGTG